MSFWLKWIVICIFTGTMVKSNLGHYLDIIIPLFLYNLMFTPFIKIYGGTATLFKMDV